MGKSSKSKAATPAVDAGSIESQKRVTSFFPAARVRARHGSGSKTDDSNRPSENSGVVIVSFPLTHTWYLRVCGLTLFRQA